MGNETQSAGHLLSIVQAVPERVMPWDSPRVVYFIQAASGPIKIGCSYVAKGRLGNLRSSHFEPLELLATLPGSFDRERFLHRAFAADRISGEWFRPTARLLELAALAKATFGEQPKPKRFKSALRFEPDYSPLSHREPQNG